MTLPPLPRPTPAPAPDPAVRRAYDRVAGAYAELLDGHLERNPWDLAVLDVFAAETARAVRGGRARVAEVGCGTGRITGRLADRPGLDVVGVDLSHGMLRRARAALPAVPLLQAGAAELPFASGSLDGVVSWYATVHTPPGQLPPLFAEFRRVLAPGGTLVVAFKSGLRPARLLRSAYGHELEPPMPVHHHPVDLVAGMLAGAGLRVTARTEREPYPDEGPVQGPQGYVLARRD
ncbi:class I SAM-dependent methyltransferase [Streptomyces sp. BI20]|uniref:class I SAM-dependent methyltransferase n=1 Tax=Streptomyces sp. BI20 TaxID=3403460 RepID=UPI003C785BAA